MPIVLFMVASLSLPHAAIVRECQNSLNRMGRPVGCNSGYKQVLTVGQKERKVKLWKGNKTQAS